ncbi:hypothetical protein DUI87_16849 [Hirundo rustica rustica]|uniref:Uncharacterized protein n=1 Tax=Hirundo rustica rustica TaxID=333673 RepID=A0A3M0K7T0_HIRRU|nr:hypothetical protein DUI87_16849 [Hirundo rustica rustica]
MESGQASGQIPPKGGSSRPSSMLPVSLWPKEEVKGPTYRKSMGFYMVLIPKSQLTISVVRTDVNIPTNSLRSVSLSKVDVCPLGHSELSLLLCLRTRHGLFKHSLSIKRKLIGTERKETAEGQIRFIFCIVNGDQNYTYPENDILVMVLHATILAILIFTGCHK